MTHTRSSDVMHVRMTNLKLGLESSIQRTNESKTYHIERIGVGTVLRNIRS